LPPYSAGLLASFSDLPASFSDLPASLA